MHRPTLTAAALAAFAGLTVAATAAEAAPMVGVNFGSNHSNRSLDASAETGVVPQQNWNNAPGHNVTEPVEIADQEGNAAGLLAYTGDLTFDYFSSTGTRESVTDDMLGSYLYGDGDTGVTIDVTNLDSDLTSQGYDIIVYFESTEAGVNVGPRRATLDLGRNGTVDQTFDFNNGAGYSSTFHETPHDNANYFRLTVPAGENIDAFTLRITAADGQADNERGIISGMQIIAVPEPASLGLVGVGVLLLIGRTSAPRRLY